jgi:glutaredoxin 3
VTDVPDVLVYTTQSCVFCERTKALLKTRGVAFREVDLARDPAGRAELQARTGMLSFPQVLIDGELIGGFQETLRADQSGELQRRLRSAA